MTLAPEPIVIRQPTGNLLSLALVVFGALAGVTILGIAIGIPFGAPFALVGYLGLGWFAARALRVQGRADASGIRIRNLFEARSIEWSDIAAVTVDRRPGGGGWGIVVSLADTSAMAIEASWGPWYASRGPLAKRNRQRCEELVEQLMVFGQTNG